MSKYWQRRDQVEREVLFKKLQAELNKELAKLYRVTLNELKVDIYMLYDEITQGEYIISDLYKFNKYYDLMNKIHEKLTELGEKEVAVFEPELIKMYKQNSEQIGHAFGLGASLNEEAAIKAVSSIWCSDGKNWSDRIWDNKAKLQNKLEQGIFDCISRGAKRSDLVKEIMQDFGVTFHQAQTLVRTELTYVQNRSTLDKFAESGVEEYEFLATDDERECEVCAKLNGKRYRLIDASVGDNMPPIHPNCRCSMLAVVAKPRDVMA